jgi:ankyrin repeat protein
MAAVRVLLFIHFLFCCALCLKPIYFGEEKKGKSVGNADYSPLHRAAQDNNLEDARDILQGLPKAAALELVNARAPSDDSSPLMLASEEGNLDMVHFLLARGADVHARVSDKSDADSDGCTALSWAAENGFPKVVAVLLGAGASVNSRTRSGMTPLLWACEDSHEAVVAELLRRSSVEVDAARYADGHTALHEAAMRGSSPIVWQLLRAGASLNATHKDNGFGALHWAVAMRHEDLALQLIFSAGADVNQRTSGAVYGARTPLLLAIETGELGMVRALLDAGASVACLDALGPCPLDLAPSNAVYQLLQLYGAQSTFTLLYAYLPALLAVLAALALPFVLLGSAASGASGGECEGGGCPRARALLPCGCCLRGTLPSPSHTPAQARDLLAGSPRDEEIVCAAAALFALPGYRTSEAALALDRGALALLFRALGSPPCSKSPAAVTACAAAVNAILLAAGAGEASEAAAAAAAAAAGGGGSAGSLVGEACLQRYSARATLCAALEVHAEYAGACGALCRVLAVLLWESEEAREAVVAEAAMGSLEGGDAQGTTTTTTIALLIRVLTQHSHSAPACTGAALALSSLACGGRAHPHSAALVRAGAVGPLVVALACLHDAAGAGAPAAAAAAAAGGGGGAALELSRALAHSVLQRLGYNDNGTERPPPAAAAAAEATTLVHLSPHRLAVRLGSCLECWLADGREPSCTHGPSSLVCSLCLGEALAAGEAAGVALECWEVLACGHEYHGKCITKWAAHKSRGAKRSAGAVHCPRCQALGTKLLASAGSTGSSSGGLLNGGGDGPGLVETQVKTPPPTSGSSKVGGKGGSKAGGKTTSGKSLR